MDQLSDLLNEYLEESEETVSSLARRCGLRREFINRLKTGTLRGSPTFDSVLVLLSSIEKKLVFVDDE